MYSENQCNKIKPFEVILQKLAHIHNSQHNQKFFDHFQTYTANYYRHSELSREEKSKFEFEEKKFSLLIKMEVCRLVKGAERPGTI